MSPSSWRAAALAAALALPSPAAATGAAMPCGPGALPRDLVAPDDPAERGLRAFGSGLAFRTAEDFVEVEADLEGQGFTVGLAKRTSENLFISLAVGTLLGASLDPGDGSRDLGASLLAQASATWRVLEGYDDDPFVTATIGISHLRSSTEGSQKLLATDLSLGVAVGKAFYERFAPYLAVKAFAGPVTWTWNGDRVNGHDLHRWAAAAGLVASTDNGFDLQVEVAPVGAKSFTLSVGGWW
jgi:hypothetical protein